MFLKSSLNGNIVTHYGQQCHHWFPENAQLHLQSSFKVRTDLHGSLAWYVTRFMVPFRISSAPSRSHSVCSVVAPTRRYKIAADQVLIFLTICQMCITFLNTFHFPMQEAPLTEKETSKRFQNVHAVYRHVCVVSVATKWWYLMPDGINGRVSRFYFCWHNITRFTGST